MRKHVDFTRKCPNCRVVDHLRVVKCENPDPTDLTIMYNVKCFKCGSWVGMPSEFLADAFDNFNNFGVETEAATGTYTSDYYRKYTEGRW